MPIEEIIFCRQEHTKTRLIKFETNKNVFHIINAAGNRHVLSYLIISVSAVRPKFAETKIRRSCDC